MKKQKIEILSAWSHVGNGEVWRCVCVCVVLLLPSKNLGDDDVRGSRWTVSTPEYITQAAAAGDFFFAVDGRTNGSFVRRVK